MSDDDPKSVLRWGTKDEYGIEVHFETDAHRAQVAALRAEIAALAAERDQLRAHILDIDAHATPYGDLPEEPGFVGTYLLTAGALHRALGTIGHSSPSCAAEAELERQRPVIEAARALVDHKPAGIVASINAGQDPFNNLMWVAERDRRWADLRHALNALDGTPGEATP